MSGNYDRKMTTEEAKKIDIRELQRRQSLYCGNTSELSWYNARTKEQIGCIGFEVKPDCLVFNYRAKHQHSQHWQQYQVIAPLTYTPCNYGNSRVWFKCPRCSKRVAILYINAQIACRTCQRLNYASQQQTKGMFQDKDRMEKIRKKLNWPIYQDMFLWQRIKPKGMHYTTFYRLVKEHDYYEMSYLSSFGATIPSLFTKLNDINKSLKSIATK
jgi:hypothetical protein